VTPNTLPVSDGATLLPLASGTATRMCPLCEATCGLELTMTDDHVASVRGHAADLSSKGYLCPKGANLAALDADPDRLRHPLIRRNGVHEPATWEEAFAAVEEGILGVRERHGADAVALYVGNPTAYTFAGRPSLPLLRQALGTRNNFAAGSADVWPTIVACAAVYGGQSRPVPDIDRTSYLVVIGANPVESNGSLVTAPDFPGRLRALRERGGVLTVVDPRRTRTAAIADRHLAIQPATDAYLLLGMIHTLFAEKLVSVERFAGQLTGLAELERVARDFPADVVSAACGIPAETIRTVARELATADSGAVYGRIGTCTVEYGTVTNWLIQALNVLTGHLDKPGGMMFPANPLTPSYIPEQPFVIGKWRSRVRRLGEVRGELPMAAMAEEMEQPGPGQVRALITLAGNPLRSAPDSRRLARAVSQLDFMVSIDPYLNETTALADVILPPPGPLQTGFFPWVTSSFMVRAVVRYSRPILGLPAGRPSEEDILHRLTLILRGDGVRAELQPFRDRIITDMLTAATQNVDSPVAGRDPAELAEMLCAESFLEEYLEVLLRLGRFGDGFGKSPEGLTLQALLEHPEGIDFGPMTPRLREVIAHPDGRMDLCPEQFLPQVDELRAGLDAPRPEFVLVGRRQLRSNNSWMHNVPNLVSGPPQCTLHMSESDADRLGIADGERALVQSRTGQVVAPVEVVPGIREGVVSLPHGWGHQDTGVHMGVASHLPGVNANDLTDSDILDVPSGNAVFSGVAVEIRRVERTEAR
jgi:anaerobic selenocysteine-containing dehydrogenase